MSLASPICLLLLPAIIPMIWLANRRRKSVAHSQVDLQKNARSTPFFGWFPNLLLLLTWVLLCVAISRPETTAFTQKRTVMSRDFVIQVDVSGSMSTALQDPAQQAFVGQQGNNSQSGNPTTAGSGTGTPPPQPTRANAARAGVKQFVEQREGDRVALLLFDDQVYFVWPLTSDLKTIEKKLPLIDQYNGGGTNFDGPSDSNQNVGAIQGAINHFKEASESKTKVLIMVTDGEDNIDPKRFVQLSQQMHDLGIRIYVLGVGDSWTNGTTPDLQRFAEANGGTVIRVGNAQDMRDGFAKINALEKSQVQVEQIELHPDVYQYFLYAALVTAILFGLFAAFVREEI